LGKGKHPCPKSESELPVSAKKMADRLSGYLHKKVIQKSKQKNNEKKYPQATKRVWEKNFSHIYN